PEVFDGGLACGERRALMESNLKQWPFVHLSHHSEFRRITLNRENTGPRLGQKAVTSRGLAPRQARTKVASRGFHQKDGPAMIHLALGRRFRSLRVYCNERMAQVPRCEVLVCISSDKCKRRLSFVK